MKQYHALILALAIGVIWPVMAVAQTATAPKIAPTAPLPPAATPPESTPVPEPGDFLLFVIGVAGLVIGRWSSRARKRRTE